VADQIPDEVLPAGPPNSRRAAIVGLLGVGSLPGLLFCGLGGVLAVIALALAPSARREIEASRGGLGGLNIVRVARLCSIVSLGIVALAVIVVVVVVLLVVQGHGSGGGRVR
jgi:hypothetical protein